MKEKVTYLEFGAGICVLQIIHEERNTDLRT